MTSKNTAYLLIGAVTGAAIGAVTATIIVKDKYRKAADEEIQEVKLYYQNKLEKLEKRVELIESLSTQDTINEDDESDENIDDFKTAVYDLGYSKEEDEYQKIIDGLNAGAYDYTSKSLKAKKQAKKASVEEDMEYHDESVLHISIEEFVNDEDFDKSTIEYFMGDCKWLAENEDDVSDLIEDMLGLDISHEILQADPSEPLYIRNIRNKTDYEVLIKEGCMEAEIEV